jgi:hypothetical protein
MMLMISRRGQGVAGEVSGSLGQLVKGSLQVVEFPPFAPYLSKVGFPLVSLDAFQGVDEQGILAAPSVFRSHSTAPPNRSVEVGSAVPIGKPHVYYTPRRAPLWPRNRMISRSD